VIEKQSETYAFGSGYELLLPIGRVGAQFFCRFASDCKKFDFSLTVPKSFNLKQKVAKVDSEIGDKSYSPIPASVKFHRQVLLCLFQAKGAS
jgi:hypothetical protein